MTTNILLGLILAVLALNLVLLVMNLRKTDSIKSENSREDLRKEIKDSRMETIQYVNQSFQTFGDMMAGSQQTAAKAQDLRLAQLNEKFSHMSMENEQKLENIRNTMSQRQ